MAEKSIKLIIKRQKDANSAPYDETFVIPYRPNMNVIAALMEIQRNPINDKGEKTTPVTWDMNCLEEVCGACSMVINGKARQSVPKLLHVSSCRTSSYGQLVSHESLGMLPSVLNESAAPAYQ